MGAVRLTQRSLWTPRAKKYASYKEAIRGHLGGSELPEVLDLEFHIPMPKSWSNKKREATRGEPHRSRIDLDNAIKGVLDAYGVEDAHVHTLTARKYWQDEGKIIIKG